MRVKVTREHIEAGCRGAGRACPIALAISEEPSVEECTVGRTTASIKDADGWTQYHLRARVRGWIADFDDGYDVPTVDVIFCKAEQIPNARLEIQTHVQLTGEAPRASV